MIINYKNINRLKKYNFLKIKKKNNKRKKVLLIDRGQVEGVVFNSLCSVLLNKKYNYNIDLLINYLGKNNPILKIYESFGFTKIININIKKNFKNYFLIIRSFFLFFISVFKISFYGKPWFIQKFSLLNIYFGDIIYDHYVRQNLNFLKKKLLNFSFLKLLFISIYKILLLNSIIQKKKYKFVLSPSHTYATNPSLGMRIALKKKITVINILSSRIRIYSKLNQAFRGEIILDTKFLKNKKIFNNFWEKKFNLMMEQRLKGKIKFYTAKNAYKNKLELNKNSLFKTLKIKKDDYKRVVFFAPHCFSDANHALGKFIFNSYFEQFTKTVKFAEKDNQSLWIIKIHPSSHIYKEEKIIYNFLKNNHVKNIIICPEDIKPISIIKISDLIISGRGTIPLECAIMGKKAIIAGETFYSGHGISIEPKTQKEYFNKILSLNKKKNLSRNKITLAKKLFYLLVFKNSHLKKDLISRSNYINLNEKKNKIVQDSFDQNIFLEKISYQLKDKINLMNDQIIKNYDKEILKYI